LLLQRRNEYIALRAYGMRIRELRAIVLSETFIVTLCGLGAGILVGTATASLSIALLRGLFVLDPRLAPPGGALSTLAVAVVGAAAVSAIAGTELLRRLEPSEILREE
jgi:ABC-type antimicrobial peptide transport system permease subunit